MGFRRTGICLPLGESVGAREFDLIDSLFVGVSLTIAAAWHTADSLRSSSDLRIDVVETSIHSGIVGDGRHGDSPSCDGAILTRVRDLGKRGYIGIATKSPQP